MLANERRYIILSKINKKNSVTVNELIETLNVSIETIRRDLEYLEKQNLLKRVYGGAISLNPSNPFLDINKRVTKNQDLKKELCMTALTYINEGDFIALDSGTTMAIFSECLKEHPVKDLTIVTYSSENFSILSDCPEYKLILLGGQYLPSEKIFHGFLTEQAIRQFHFQKSFVVPSALSLAGGAQDFIPETHSNQLYLLSNSDEVFLLADSTKFEKTGSLKLCGLENGHTIITDSRLPDELYNMYTAKQIKIHF